MDAGQLTVDAELGEEADHHGAQQVAPAGVCGLRDLVLKQLERLCRISRLPRGKGRVRRVAAQDEPGAGDQAREREGSGCGVRGF